jgi:hypothetical protein
MDHIGTPDFSSLVDYVSMMNMRMHLHLCNLCGGAIILLENKGGGEVQAVPVAPLVATAFFNT